MPHPTVYPLAARRFDEPAATEEDHVVGQAFQGVRERGAVGRIVQQAFTSVLDEAGDPGDSRGDHRQPGRHVLEHLERRPVEAE